MSTHVRSSISVVTIVHNFCSVCQLTRKNLMVKNLKRLRKQTEREQGKNEAQAFDFYPTTYELPVSIWASVKISRSMTKPNNLTFAPIEDSDQPGHPPSLIRVFTVRMKKAWVLSYPLSAQRRLIRLGGCLGWSESSLGAQFIFLVLSCGGSNISVACLQTQMCISYLWKWLVLIKSVEINLKKWKS